MNASEPVAMVEVEIWNRIIRPEEGNFTEAEAKTWLQLRLADMDLERMRTLSAKANVGALTSAEDLELERYLIVGSTLDFLKAKARMSLKNPNP